MRSFRFSYTVRLSIVYSPSRGKCLTGPVVGAQKEGGKATPLVAATIEFLRVSTSSSVFEMEGEGEEEEDGLATI